jgi:hypothetical protein
VGKGPLLGRTGHQGYGHHRQEKAEPRRLEQRLRERDRELADQLRHSPLWREREELLRGVPGVGPTVCATLLADLPELGQLNQGSLITFLVTFTIDVEYECDCLYKPKHSSFEFWILNHEA